MRISITLNGQPYVCSADVTTVFDLVRQLGMEGKRVAVERNGEIVPKSRYSNTPLSIEDKFEVVAAVGGG